MLGVLSLLDAIIESPMEVIAKSLPLRAEARAALLGENNAVAVPLNLFRSFEGGAWDTCIATSVGLGVSEETLASLYFDSVKWATELVAAS
jgi:EAL and modified HD-GYP domain-containing signal transduction protein